MYDPMIAELKKLKKKMEEADDDITKEKNSHAGSLNRIETLRKQKVYLQDQLRKAGKTIKQLTTELGTANDELTVKTLQVNKLERIRKQVLAGLMEMKDDLNRNNKEKNGH
tara:strand:+ start:288 stop:620 length:333 start_codon:yes stop_codon:yes gene_type:complete